MPFSQFVPHTEAVSELAMFAPTAGETAPSLIRLDDLREAIRNNHVTFPAQVPIFACQHRVDIQWRLAGLYFVHGWSATRLGRRYKVSSRRVHQLLRLWVNRALTLGYLQEIPPEPITQAAASPSNQGREVEFAAVPMLPLPSFAAAARAAGARTE